jgi:hypothetical protein
MRQPRPWFALAIARASASVGLPRACPRALVARESGNRSLVNHFALALGQGGVEMQNERLDIRASSAATNGTRCAIKSEMR